MKTRKLKYTIFAFAGILALTVTARAENPDKLSVNTTDSKVNWIGKKPGGEHNGTVKIATGEILMQKNEIKGGSFVIDLNSIKVLDIQDEGMNGRLLGHLKSADFFDVEKYPTARFVITKVSKLTSQTAASAKATHVRNGKIIASTQPFSLNRTLWGVNYQSKSIFANLKDQFIDDDMTLSVELVSK
jgi:polyisoprenoid-binding protein YceI